MGPDFLYMRNVHPVWELAGSSHSRRGQFFAFRCKSKPIPASGLLPTGEHALQQVSQPVRLCGMDIIPDKRKIVGLVEQAHEGKICLPNFQRDFVWTREEVADLVRSIVRGYFIGSLLLLRCDPASPPFAPVFLRGAKPPYRETRPDLLVLDGQQRLSSLIYALTAPDLSLKDSSQRR
jgi:hypothetical protein